VTLLNDRRDPSGHAVVERQDGTVFDPAGQQHYASMEAYLAARPEYSLRPEPQARGIPRSSLERVFKTPPNSPQRALALAATGLSAIGSVGVADTVNPAIFPYPPPCETNAQAMERLVAIRDFWTAQPAPMNRLGAFATAYIEMTEELMASAAAYRAAGNVAQAEAIEAMVTPFANEYFEAFAAHQATANPLNQPVPANVPREVPQVWQVHFETAMNPEMPMAAVLATAMNAHILYDLPRVVGQLGAEGHPAYQLQPEQAYLQNQRNFLDYGEAFGRAGEEITAALTEHYGTNDVTVAFAVAEYFGASESGVGMAVEMMRSTAFDVARMLMFNEGHEVNFDTADLDRVVADYSRGFAGNIDAAVDSVQASMTDGNPGEVDGELVSAAISGGLAGLNTLFTLDYLNGIPEMPFQPVATPPTTGTPDPNQGN
jgi:hypothetical protein